jgi:hypothetical protein
MTRSVVFASILSVAAFAAQAESPDASGQFGASVNSGKSVAAVRADAAQAPRVVGNPWSTQYNPLANFTSQRTRAQVQADYVADRDRVAAFTGEDSGSAYLAARQPVNGARVFAGQPVNAQ